MCVCVCVCVRVFKPHDLWSFVTAALGNRIGLELVFVVAEWLSSPTLATP